VAGGLTWWILKRQLAPVFTTIKKMAALSDSDQASHALPITSQDEIGQLIGGFNHLLETLKNQAETVKESEQRYRMIFNNAPLGIMHFDANGTIVDFNDKFAWIMGGTREKIIGFNMLEKLSDHAMLTAVRDALDGRLGHYEGDYVSITAGKTTPMRAVYQRITTEDGNFLGAVGLFEDITERRQAEANLRRLASEQSIILDNAGVAITFVQNRQFKWINTALCQMFCYSSEEITDASTRLIYPSQENFEQTGQEAYLELATGRTFAKELLLRRSNGSLFHAL
jgi:PAS domain S-box-containing protein